jgi:IS30 family transposase
MGRGKALTPEEYWWIIGLHDGGVSLHEIARKTGRARTCVRRAIKAERGPVTDVSGNKAKSGRQLVLTEREVRLLVRKAATGSYFAAELKTDLGTVPKATDT